LGIQNDSLQSSGVPNVMNVSVNLYEKAEKNMHTHTKYW